MPTTRIKGTELAKGFTVGDYHAAVNHEDKVAIAEAIKKRFTERYIEPASAKDVHGFTRMAVSCLMMEAMQSFRDGLADTNGKSRKTLVKFLKTSQRFSVFTRLEDGFFYDIRCSILHQAEVKSGWRILRTGPLFAPATKTINATRFLNALSDELKVYCDQLTKSDWDSPEWKNARKKMDAICKNCEPV